MLTSPLRLIIPCSPQTIQHFRKSKLLSTKAADEPAATTETPIFETTKHSQQNSPAGNIRFEDEQVTEHNTVTAQKHARYAVATLGDFGLFAKQVLHITGLPWVGLNGTVVPLPHSEQVTCVSIRRRPVVPSLLALHCLQCLGSLVNPFSWKNCCSPAENTNSRPQPAHRTSRSAKGMIHSSTLSGFREGSMGTAVPL